MKKKILCICDHGNVRSVALAYLIKTIYKHETIAVGDKNITPKTMKMLKEWADLIIDARSIVGEDIWHDPFAQELQHKLLRELNKFDL